MAQIKEPSKAKLIVGLMYSNDQILARALYCLVQQFGPIQINGPTIEFNFTKYYEEEMGELLKKTYIAFTAPIKIESLPEIKQFTNKIECDLSKQEKRTINIDPGYVTVNQVVLASAKEHPHRIYLSCGIYGQIVLVFCRNEWIPVEKTFADYKQKEVKEFLISVRSDIVTIKH